MPIIGPESVLSPRFSSFIWSNASSVSNDGIFNSTLSIKTHKFSRYVSFFLLNRKHFLLWMFRRFTKTTHQNTLTDRLTCVRHFKVLGNILFQYPSSHGNTNDEKRRKSHRFKEKVFYLAEKTIAKYTFIFYSFKFIDGLSNWNRNVMKYLTKLNSDVCIGCWSQSDIWRWWYSKFQTWFFS